MVKVGSNLVAPWIVHKLMGTGMEGLSSIYRVQYHFVTNHDLKGETHT